ncbi:UDP-N-acetylglucosamine 2-epimerase (non-hydrolyzing) [Parabacteroides sp. PFB2-10]|uniref:non-hydrolyzing UDP-N-acetylglucosamine 2-epimerase n=1 Tax=Parabacteroides sp. PFB2-10 TaxID=1742405 RepID=UPI00247308D3|nr:UDP-N-acetylglucosamine 2-epimerase (non-hydrolyzing) [Parabacteroides sp. PFB2-10]MDH6313530.1 UDP-N-acetylglucosamine 2-epimerase (non-hydrolyzing) [Parabacteroides sp. PFB2-10]
MKKIMLVFGTRPEAIKMCPLVRKLKLYPEEFQTIVCVTAQHREMLDQVLLLFDVKPDYDLNIMKQGQDLYDITTRVLSGLRDVLKEVQPDMVLVHGDTTTSMVAALAAFYQQIPVGHVEAGLRTHNIYSPWPEEMNRQITTRIATSHFAPTLLSKENLLKENVSPENIYVVGNTVIDALHIALNQIKKEEQFETQIHSTLASFGISQSLLSQWEKEERRLILITGHRRENFGEGFRQICKAIKRLAQSYPDVDFVYPMHLNPNVRKPLQEVFGENPTDHPNVYLIEPVDYLPFVYLMDHAYIVLTDSGGIQEEAPGLGKPVLVMRDTTERPEAVTAGTVKLVGTDYEKIVSNVELLLIDKAAYQQMGQAVNPYGDGKSSERIAGILKAKRN